MTYIAPDMAETEEHFENMDAQEKVAFDSLIRPDDSYTTDGVYWADLPILQRIKFSALYDTAEAKREMNEIWAWTKKDPVIPVAHYFKNFVMPGAGLLLEGYVLFSIGNIKPLFEDSFTACWKDHTVCNKNWQAAITYLEVAGIIFGQLIVGLLGDWIGRRWGLIQDATVMLIGLLMLTAAWGVTQNGWIICYAWSLFVYGVGVGGEYPMTCSGAMENAIGSGKISTREDRLHRGRKAAGAFLMQGWGPLFNQGVLILLLLIFHHGDGQPPYSETTTQWIYRVTFAIPAVGTLWLVYYRVYHMKGASRQLNVAKKRASVAGYDVESLRLTVKYFFPRLIGTAVSWFCNDVFFWGNKLFQSKFIAVLNPHSTGVMGNWLWNLLNIGMSLAGYYMATFLIDNKLYGRKYMQIVGFLLDFVLFIIPAFRYDYYTSPEHVHAFQAMYFLSSFFNQFGPNVVTFVVSGEVYPTPVRATAHGISAACGKVGALWISVAGSYLTVQQQFYIVPWFGLAGVIVTYLFLPDTTGLDLKEQERRWKCLREGREHDYHGPAVHPRHLSVWERFRGKDKFYNAELDYKQKVEEYRAEWTVLMTSRVCEETDVEQIAHDTDDTLLDGHVHRYFHRTSPMAGGMAESKIFEKRNFTLPPAAQTFADSSIETHEEVKELSNAT